MHLQFVGCGDAFGSGGRGNTCFHVSGERVNFLIDCGASSLPALKRFGVARDAMLEGDLQAAHRIDSVGELNLESTSLICDRLISFSLSFHNDF